MIWARAVRGVDIISAKVENADDKTPMRIAMENALHPNTAFELLNLVQDEVNAVAPDASILWFALLRGADPNKIQIVENVDLAHSKQGAEQMLADARDMYKKASQNEFCDWLLDYGAQAKYAVQARGAPSPYFA